MPDLRTHPELIYGPNPLLEALPPFVPYASIAEKLVQKPLDGLNWREIPPEYRTPLLSKADFHYIPMPQNVEAADGIQTLIRRSLFQRNPLDPSEQVRVNRFATVETEEEFNEAIMALGLDGGGGVFQGITGSGKTTTTVRALQTFAPQQVIVHKRNPACGWSHLVQVVYLYVAQPPQGSRGGLFLRILEVLDNLTGSTTKRSKHGKGMSLDALLNEVYKALVIHRVALLIIDENQAQNLSESANFAQFCLFFLNLMSLGISVLVVGNPNAFSQLSSLSQLVRRFSVGGVHSFKPANALNDELWRDYFVPGMREFCLVDEIDIDPVQQALLESKLCAGIPGLYRALWVESQRQCLRRGGDRAVMTIADIEDASTSPAFIEARPIAKTVSLFEESSSFTDISHSFSSDFESSKLSDEDIRKAHADADAFKRQITNEKRQFSRKKSEELAAVNRLAKLKPEDLRRLGATKELLRSMESHIKKSKGTG